MHNYMSAVATLCGMIAAEEAKKRRLREIGELPPEPPAMPDPQPVTYLAGRNDKCPCGSGKKYKKCCRP